MRALNWSVMSDWVVPQLGQPFLKGELGLVRGERLQRFCRCVGGNSTDRRTALRLAIVATDLQSGVPVVFTAGNGTGRARFVGDPRRICATGNSRTTLYRRTSQQPATGDGSTRSGCRCCDCGRRHLSPEDAAITILPDVVFQAFMIASQRLVAELQRRRPGDPTTHSADQPARDGGSQKLVRQAERQRLSQERLQHSTARHSEMNKPMANSLCCNRNGFGLIAHF